jgi:hypothetical protein
MDRCARHPEFLTTDAVRLGVCASAGYVSYSIWKEARQESEGHFHRLVEAGEGRTRFLAVVGMGFSALFVVATFFGT